VPQQSPISFPMGTKNVLIIDGNEAMQQLRARMLRSRGVHVHTAKSVTEAELLWVPDFFDLVLLDVRQRSKEAVEFLENDSAPPSRSADEVPSWTSNVPVSYLRRRGLGPRTRFLKTGCRGQDSCMSHKALQTDSSQMETIN
jgi:CheY-like chemotaxis protein